MGKGRRIKRRQGMPDPAPEEHSIHRKRKAALPVDGLEPEEEKARSKKRRTSKKPEPPKSNGNRAKNGTAKKDAGQPGQANGSRDRLDGKGAMPGTGGAATRKPAAKKAQDFDDDPDEEMAGELDASDLDGATLGDDFLGSDDGDEDEESDSVFDSDHDAGGESGRKEAFAFSDDEDDSVREEMLTAANIFGLSHKLDKKLEKVRAANEAELQESALQTNIADEDKPHVLGGVGEDGEDEADELAVGKSKTLLAPDLQLLRQRITDAIRVLDDFASLSEPGRSRAEYTAQLLKDICSYYGYSAYLADKLFGLFAPREAFAFFEANETPRPVVIRTNTLRTHRRELAQALINRGVTLEPVGKWSKVGLQIFESQVPLGATPEYLAGHYMLQAASSFLPVMALGPQENERVLDMAAAPGGKTTHCAAMMKNTGVVFANDPNKARTKGLIGNLHRLGCQNVVVCSYDARGFPRVMGGFDRVLLDAPCSGTGVVAKDPSIKTNKTEKDFMLLSHTQKQLLLAAIDSVNHASKTGGYLVYSTCSVTVEENEGVVAYALSRRPNVKLVETGLTFGKEGFTSYMGKQFGPSLKLTRRYYPHSYNVDGFFVAKFKKIGPTPANAVLAPEQKSKKGNSSSSKSRTALVGVPDGEEEVDRTPIAADEDDEAEEQGDLQRDGDGGGDGGKKKKKDGFGGFDDDEDRKHMERARRNAMRKRGLDPNALQHSMAKPKKVDGGAKSKSSSGGEQKSKERGGGGGGKEEKVQGRGNKGGGAKGSKGR